MSAFQLYRTCFLQTRTTTKSCTPAHKVLPSCSTILRQGTYPDAPWRRSPGIPRHIWISQLEQDIFMSADQMWIVATVQNGVASSTTLSWFQRSMNAVTAPHLVWFTSSTDHKIPVPARGHPSLLYFHPDFHPVPFPQIRPKSGLPSAL